MIARDILRAVRRLEIRSKRALAGPLAGLAPSTVKGRGLSFLEVRPYAPGDNVRDIDWKVTARFGRPFLKTYVNERQRTIWLLADVSPSMRFGSVGRTKQDLLQDAVAVLAMVCARDEDRVGLITFGGSRCCLPPSRGRRHALRLLRELLVFDERGPVIPFLKVVAQFRKLAKQKALVFVLSDFRFQGVEFGMRALAHRHEVRAFHFVDPWERELPRLGLVCFRDVESGQTRWLDSDDDSLRTSFARNGSVRLRQLRHCFAKSRIEYHEIPTEFSIVQTLARQLATHSATIARKGPPS